MKLLFVERPSALPAALLQVAGAPARSAAPTAHVELVGCSAAWTTSIDGARKLAAPIQGEYQGTSVFAGTGINLTKSSMNGVGGVPPRGRPV
jgi:hypothetical protein